MSKATAAALVTGGAKRIGKAIVEDLAGHGFAVVHFEPITARMRTSPW